MKKIKNKSKYLKYQKRKFRRSLDHRREYLIFRKEMNKLRRRLSKRQKGGRKSRPLSMTTKNVVSAPKNLSLGSNTEEVINFIKEIENKYNKRESVFVGLKKVTSIDYGAIVVLLSIMVKFRSSKIRFNGDFPDDIGSRTKLQTSGFFDNLYKNFIKLDRYSISANNADGILTHAWRRVDSKLGARLIKAASLTIWGDERRCQGVQRVLLELMQNTNNHASINKKGEKHWWLSVNHIKNDKKVCFAFVDFGVGVFTSLANKPNQSKFFNWTEKIIQKYKYGNNAELLKLILDGDFHQTVTGEYFRGKGLPGIAQVYNRKQISELKIITNDVCYSSNPVEFRKMNSSFNGTYIYWEVNSSNGNCK